MRCRDTHSFILMIWSAIWSTTWESICPRIRSPDIGSTHKALGSRLLCTAQGILHVSPWGCMVMGQGWLLEKLLGLWMNLPLYRPRSTRSSRWMLFSIMADKLYSHWTMDQVLRHVVWSLWALFRGEIPQTGPFGGPLPSNWVGREGQQIIQNRKLQFICTEYRGDWEWHRDLWHFVGCSWQSKSVCWMCRAERTDDWNNAYWNLEENSLWADSPFTLAEFMALRQPDRGLCHQAATTSFFTMCLSQGL